MWDPTRGKKGEKTQNTQGALYLSSSGKSKYSLKQEFYSGNSSQPKADFGLDGDDGLMVTTGYLMTRAMMSCDKILSAVCAQTLVTTEGRSQPCTVTPPPHKIGDNMFHQSYELPRGNFIAIGVSPVR